MLSSRPHKSQNCSNDVKSWEITSWVEENRGYKQLNNELWSILQTYDNEKLLYNWLKYFEAHYTQICNYDFVRQIYKKYTKNIEVFSKNIN